MEIRRLETITRLGLWDCDLSPDGQAVAAVYQEDEGPRLGVWRTTGCDWVREVALPGTAIEGPMLPQQTPQVTYARPRFSPDGRRLAAARKGGGVTVWSLPDGEMVLDYVPQGGREVATHAFGPSGESIAIAQGNRLELWGIERGEWLWVLGLAGPIASMRSAANGQLIAVGLRSGGAVVVDLEARHIVAARPEIAQPVTALAFHPSEPQLLAATAPTFLEAGGRLHQAAHGWAYLWDYRTGEDVARIPCDYHAALLGGGRFVATLTDNSRSLWIWRIPEYEVAAHIANVVPEVMVDEERGFAGRRVTLTATPAGDVLAVAGLSRPFSAVGALHLYAFQAEAVPQL
ncbi:MAG TPA: WD40 repeat domain-containing protein [Anaerolineae bacterium]|nr:WD40 repeat domain-containing protein [Anaerolineae bacterium]HOQ99236.1 WD40 repeat domain-containing protein [Anaerolineae bacterium]HPL28061.1 WD40 repeat domain-containing protein [Anaerolineae bacterium]